MPPTGRDTVARRRRSEGNGEAFGVQAERFIRAARNRLRRAVVHSIFAFCPVRAITAFTITAVRHAQKTSVLTPVEIHGHSLGESPL